MASSPSMAASLLLLYMSAMSFLQSASSLSGSSSICHTDSAFFIYTLQSQCPLSISPNPPLEVDGNFIEGVLSGKETGYISVLFYASWCPFSQRVLPLFEALSYMFPQVEHVALEQSSALPSVFSRYGIHSLPAILLVNQTSRFRYCGSKSLPSLVQFYERNTGFKPVQDFAFDGQWSSSRSDERSTKKSLMSLSLKAISSREPYLLFSVLFLCLRILLSVFPAIVWRIRAFWVSYVPHLNLQIFGETSQVIGRVLHVIDVRRIWTKLRVFKTRNFHERARSARVWASSLASVSLGESSSARSSSQGLN